MNKPERPAVEDIDDLLRTDSYLWSALHKHGRERRLEAELLGEMNDLLDLRLSVMAAEKDNQ